jgi:hypothetical protein
MQSIGTFWRSYRGAWRAATRVGDVPSGFHTMLMVIGISTTVEYTLTALYENTLGRLAEWVGGTRGAADRLAAEEAAAYSDLIHRLGWYRFDFWPYVPRLWAAPLGSGGQAVRSLERKLFLSAVWSVKAAYAQLLTWALAGDAPDHPTRHLVLVDRTRGRQLPAGVTARPLDRRGYELLEVPRYRRFEALLHSLAQDPRARIVEANGSPAVVLTARVAEGAELPAGSEVVMQYRAVPDSPGAAPRQRVVLTVPAHTLLETLRVLDGTPGVSVDHVYDF